MHNPDASTFRGIVVLAGLKGETLPASLRALEVRRYDHRADAATMWTIAELAIDGRHAVDAATTLSNALLPTRFYAHLVSPRTMYVAFPNYVAIIRRGDASSVAICQQIGRSFEIPDAQMRFAEMFDNDHPDAPT